MVVNVLPLAAQCFCNQTCPCLLPCPGSHLVAGGGREAGWGRGVAAGVVPGPRNAEGQNPNRMTRQMAPVFQQRREGSRQTGKAGWWCVARRRWGRAGRTRGVVKHPPGSVASREAAGNARMPAAAGACVVVVCAEQCHGMVSLQEIPARCSACRAYLRMSVWSPGRKCPRSERGRNAARSVLTARKSADAVNAEGRKWYNASV